MGAEMTPDYFIEVARMPWDEEARNQVVCKMVNFNWALRSTEKHAGITIAIFKIYKHRDGKTKSGIIINPARD